MGKTLVQRNGNHHGTAQPTLSRPLTQRQNCINEAVPFSIACRGRMNYDYIQGAEQMAQDIADKLFATTPRTVISMISGVFLAYGVMLTQFATNEQLESVQIAMKQQKTVLYEHIDASTIWQIERVLDDVSDKRKDIENRMKQTDGDKTGLLEWDNDLSKRESEYRTQLNCLRGGGKYCLSETDH